ncbi:hypothetical protein ES332_D07G233200v1 [Gossypium tomentosum]|uniref:Uncharacterized protein n=1 Tax=Gossypium tomentosum TaxID=34277 RepID=A0A5D2KAP2_GOSTO|nr:hypothetical protein ES332_D07G233200v1 [Gossypium tomentosum]
MLNKFLNVRKLAPFYSHGRPKPVAQLQKEPRENQGTSALKIVHPGGVVECYYMAIPAVNIMKNYPSSVLARPEVFRRPWDSLVRSHEILTPGQKFYVVPRHTVRKLRRRIRKTSGEVSVSQSSIDVSKYGSSSKQLSRKNNGTKKHVRFAGVDVIKTSKDEGIAIAENTKKKSNIEFQQQGGKGKQRLKKGRKARQQYLSIQNSSFTALRKNPENRNGHVQEEARPATPMTVVSSAIKDQEEETWIGTNKIL